MAEPFVGEIKLVPYNFAPLGWAFCAGQTIPIAQNEVLFILIGTTYGGDGQNTYQLPDLRGRTPIHQNSSFPLGAIGGSESVTLNLTQIPSHSHALHVASTVTTTNDPTGEFLGTVGAKTLGKTYSDSFNVTMGTSSISSTGSGFAHNNIQPYLALNYIIALEGIFPSQN